MKHFIADLHLDDADIFKVFKRPFATSAEHDAFMIEQINTYVSERDELFLLGDICSTIESAALIKQIRCKNLVLVWGNHEPHNQIRTAIPAVVAAAFSSVHLGLEISLGDHKCWLSHYPHFYWPNSHRMSYHLYGHVHAQREQTMDLALPDRRSVDVGVENSLRLLGEYRPFSESDVLSMLSPRIGHDPIEYYKSFEPTKLAG